MLHEQLVVRLSHRLAETHPEIASAVRFVADAAGPAIEIDENAPDGLLELRPPAEVSEVPVWAELSHGRTELYDLGFEPERIFLVRWDDEHRRRGLSVGFPQMLVTTAVAGQGHRAPVAGGRRVDRRLEVWLQASATGRVRADVEAASELGFVADLRWRVGGEHGRLLIGLGHEVGGRRLGQARLPIDPARSLDALDVLVLADLSHLRSADDELMRASAAAACTSTGIRFWDELLRTGLGPPPASGARAA